MCVFCNVRYQGGSQNDPPPPVFPKQRKLESWNLAGIQSFIRQQKKIHKIFLLLSSIVLWLVSETDQNFIEKCV